MYTQLALDLRLARRKAGLLQRDCAMLLGISPQKLCRIERGSDQPNLTQIIALSVIYGRSFEGYFADLLQTAKARINERLPELPREVQLSTNTAHRRFTLDRLRREVSVQNDEDDGL